MKIKIFIFVLLLANGLIGDEINDCEVCPIDEVNVDEDVDLRGLVGDSHIACKRVFYVIDTQPMPTNMPENVRLVVIKDPQYFSKDTVVENTRRLFDKELLNSSAILRLFTYQYLYEELRECRKNGDVAQLNESINYIVDAISNFKINVSTNIVDDGIAYDALTSRRWIFKLAIDDVIKFQADTNAYLRIAKHIGGVREVDFPGDLCAIVSLNFTDEQVMKYRKWVKDRETERKVQERVQQKNGGILAYRRELIRACKNGIMDMRKDMSDDEFATFLKEFTKLCVINNDEMVRMKGK